MPEDLLQHCEAIEEVLAQRPCGLVLDLDGTISEIAPRPADASVSPLCRQRLAALKGLLELVAVVSGRRAMEARKMVDIQGLVYLGCHGLERLEGNAAVLDPAVAPYKEKMREAAARLAGRLLGQPGLEGLLVEDKGISTTFHYRACRDPDRARGLILKAVEDLKGDEELRVMEARRAVELLPDVPIDKGTVLTALVGEYGLRGVFYLGDDHTDLSAFRALSAWRSAPALERAGYTNGEIPDRRGFPAPPGRTGLAVAVVSEDSAEEVRMEADFILMGIPAVEEYLAVLHRLFQPPVLPHP